MSVVAAALTMDQRPPLHSYDKMSKQYEQNLNAVVVGGAGSVMTAPPSGPASPTPSASEEQQFHHQQQQHHRNVAAVEQRQRLLEDEIENLKLEQTRLSQQFSDAQRREKILMRRLANKEQEFQDYVSQIAEYKASQAPSALALRSALLDPAVNLLFEKLKKELKATKAKLEETQNELSAWKFTPDSNTGKRLMAKCRLLYQENEELGKMTSNGRLAKLETELAMQKSFSEEVKKSQSELDDFLQELDEDVEGMQSTILFLQQELKTTRDRIQVLEKENYQLRNGTPPDNNTKVENVPLNGTTAKGAPYDSTNQCQTNNNAQAPTDIANICTNESKFPGKGLETIAEHCVGANDYYNGAVTEDKPLNCIAGVAHPPLVGIMLAPSGGDDVSSNSSSFSSTTNVTTVKLRTAAARKRGYENDPLENAALNHSTTPSVPLMPVSVLPTHVASPRTLPPKKSKLRRPSVQSVDMSDYDNATSVVGGCGVGGVIPGDPLSIVDNAVVGMANEETTPASVVHAEPEVTSTEASGGVAQRIMTRRRSVRQQQNGSGGGDSNH